MADTAITIARSRITPLLNPERHAGFTHKFKVKYSDIQYGTGSTDTVTMTIGTTPAKWIIPQAMANVTTAFAGAGSQALTMKVGATDDDFAIAATSVFTAGIIQPSTGCNTVAAIATSTSTSAQTLKIIFTNATAGSPSELTAGEVDVYLKIVDTAKLP